MTKFYDKQTELLCYLNDNMIEPYGDTKAIAEILDISFVDSDELHGWIIDGEN